MRLSHDVHIVRTKDRFVVARGGASEFSLVRVCVRDDDGIEGWGEAAPNRFYGETVESVVAAIARFASAIEGLHACELDESDAVMNGVLRFNGSAKAAISAACHDLVAKRLGVPLYQLLGLSCHRVPLSSFTIGIAADQAELLRRLDAAASYPVLKVKLGSDHDEEIIRTVREAAPGKVLRADANAGWTVKRALQVVDVLADCDFELLEQPLPPGDLDGLGFVRERSPLPVIADESCVVSSDIPPLAGRADGINIKLAKCGGVREALRMIATARAHGMLVMMGCMVESSLGITTAAHLASLLDFADLDGATLLANDPFVGATIDRGVITLPAGAGLGVTERRPA